MAEQPIPPIPQPDITPGGSKKAQIFTATAINAAEMHEGVEKLTKNRFFAFRRQWHCFPSWVKEK